MLSIFFLSGAGTSGGELEEESWQPPDPELTQKLVAQIEYYLSDENLEHDAFLLKHVRRNKLGFVSVKLLTSFKKVTFDLLLTVWLLDFEIGISIEYPGGSYN